MMTPELVCPSESPCNCFTYSPALPGLAFRSHCYFMPRKSPTTIQEFLPLQVWGMNCYLYAPKDDCKHRAYWREPYTVEEADHLQSLITLATECNIDFCYAISPGMLNV